MSDYISRDAAIDSLMEILDRPKHAEFLYTDEICGTLKSVPTADAREVVRCKDCKWYEIRELKKDGTDDRRYKPSLCVRLGYQMKQTFFCADGEKRDGDSDV